MMWQASYVLILTAFVVNFLMKSVPEKQFHYVEQILMLDQIPLFYWYLALTTTARF